LVKSRFSNYEHANGSKVAPSSWERKRNKQVISGDGGAAGLRLGMKRVLFFFCLIAVAVSVPTTPYSIRVANLERDRALGAAIPSSPNCIPSTQLAVLPANEREVHAVVVDMPQRAALEYASPDTWATLPNFDPPIEESPKPVLQVALN